MLLQDEPLVGQCSGTGHRKGGQMPPGRSLEAVEESSDGLVRNPSSRVVHPTPPAPPLSPGQKLQIWINATPWRGTWLSMWPQSAPMEVHGAGGAPKG